MGSYVPGGGTVHDDDDDDDDVNIIENEGTVRI